MLLYGSAGAMKSWMAEYMGWCIATGTEWLIFKTTQARTLVVNFEISSLGYYWRLRNMSRHFVLPDELSFYEASPGMMPLEDESVFQKFAEDVNTVEPKVIILDCFQGFFSGNDSATEEVSPLLLNLSELKKQNKASLIIVHHANKNELANSPMARARGTTKLVGWVDSVVRLVEQPKGRQLQFEKYRMSAYELHPLNVQFEDYMWTLR